MYKWIVKNSPLLIVALLIVAMLTIISRGTSVQEISGLAIAGPNSQWINLNDVSVGTPIASGAAGVGPYWYNGTNYDAAKGDTTNGLWVNVKSSVSSVGNKTPTDAYANPTDGTDSLSFLMGWNGATWDRLKSSTANGLVADVSRIVAALPTGTNSIGNIGTVATVSAVTAITNALPAGTNTIGSVNQGTANTTANSWPIKTCDGTNCTTLLSTPPTGTENANPVRVVPNRRSRIAINISATGDQTIISAVTNQIISIYKINVVCAAANTVIYKDGVAGTAINGAGFSLAANGGWAYDGDQNPIVLTVSNAFVENNSAATNCSGFVIYTQG